MADKQTWNDRYRNKSAVWSLAPNRLFREVTGQLEPGRALDLGCGEGRNALWLAQHGWRVMAIDYAQAGIAKAKQRADAAGVVIDYRVDDAASVNLEPASFDLVAIVFLHTGEAERAHWLPACAAAVAPGGHFVYIGHDPLNITDGTGGPQNPAVLPDVGTIVAELGQYEVLRGEIVRRAVGDDPGHGGTGEDVALDTLVVARRQ